MDILLILISFIFIIYITITFLIQMIIAKDSITKYLLIYLFLIIMAYNHSIVLKACDFHFIKGGFRYCEEVTFK